jgi:hypothetical protein
MAGPHYSQRSALARRREHHLLTVIASLRAGTRTVGPARLTVYSDRFCVMSRSGGVWETELWTVRPGLWLGGLGYGAGGRSRSAGRLSRTTSTRAEPSVAMSATPSGDIYAEC